VTGAAILAEGLGRRFGDIVAVDGVDLEVPAGTVLGLLGPNGAGKTTIVRILTTILRPDRGRATVLGLDVARQPQAVRTVIGLAGQYAAVDENLTGRENLRMVGRLTHQRREVIAPRADELLARFGQSAPTRAGCAAGSTWPPPWSTGRRSCSSTSPPPDWIPGAAATSGR
jgi:ABC-2 type transport system ATP-binding protein